MTDEMMAVETAKIEESPEVTEKETEVATEVEAEAEAEAKTEETEETEKGPVTLEDTFSDIEKEDMSTRDKTILYLMKSFKMNPDLVKAISQADFDTAWEKIREANAVNLTVQAKLQKELGNVQDDRVKIVRFLLEKAKDPTIAAQILLEHKEFNRCFRFITEKVKKSMTASSSSCIQVNDDKVYQWALEYYALDDYAEVMEERRKAEEARKKAEESKKKAAEKKAKKAKKDSSKVSAAEETPNATTQEHIAETVDAIPEASTPTTVATENSVTKTAETQNPVTDVASESPKLQTGYPGSTPDFQAADVPLPFGPAEIPSATVEPEQPATTETPEEPEVQPEQPGTKVPPEEDGTFTVCGCSISSEDGQMVFCF